MNIGTIHLYREIAGWSTLEYDVRQYPHRMSNKPEIEDLKPEIEDLTQMSDEDLKHEINIELPPAVRAALQAEADKRNVTLEEYLRGLALTAAAVVNAGGSSRSRGGKA